MTDQPLLAAPSRLSGVCWTVSRDAIFVADTRTRVLVEVNPAAEQMMGYTRAELIGMPADCLHPESERTALKDSLQRLMADNKSVENFHIERKVASWFPSRFRRQGYLKRTAVSWLSASLATEVSWKSARSVSQSRNEHCKLTAPQR